MRWRESGAEGFRQVQIPIEIRLSLRQGTVYYMAERGLSSLEPHCFVVLNQNPLGSKILLLLVASSQVEKAQKRVSRKNLPTESLVVIDDSEYDDFSKESCIDCNKLFNKSLEELCAQWKKKEIRAHKDLPRELVKKLIEGVKASPLISEEDKALIDS
jgi:hypothetical protein